MMKDAAAQPWQLPTLRQQIPLTRAAIQGGLIFENRQTTDLPGATLCPLR
jgi:hypothetical protein